MAILLPLFVALLTVAAMLFVASPLHYIKKIAKALGFGWVTYHSDSQKNSIALQSAGLWNGWLQHTMMPSYGTIAQKQQPLFTLGWRIK